MSSDVGGGGGIGSTLAAIVKRLFRWTTSSGELSSSSSEGSSSGVIIGSDLNGNVQHQRFDAVSSAAAAADMKDPFQMSRFRRTGLVVCHRCGGAERNGELSEFQTTVTIGTNQLVVCMRCFQKLKQDYVAGHRRSTRDDASRRQGPDGGSGGRHTVEYGEPVCCCDSCAVVATRLRPLVLSSLDSASKVSESEVDLLFSSSSSLPSSSSCGSSTSLLPAKSRPRLATMQTTAQHLSSTNEFQSARSASDRLAGGRRHQPRSPPADANLPPAIPLSLDGEDTYLAYQRSLMISNKLAVESSLSNGRAPPNVTIRHLTDDDGASVARS